MIDWVVLELTSKGVKEEPEVLRKAISRTLKNAEVYVPAVETTVGEEKVVHYLIEGYIFVRKDLPDLDYFRLENSKYIESVLVKSGTFNSRKVGTVSQSYIGEMREKVRAEVNQGIGVGDIVRICSGAYKNIEATVITEIPEEKQVQVYVQLRSKEAILTLPRSVLEVLDRAPLSSYFARLGYLRSWAAMAKVVLSYKGSPERAAKTYQIYCDVCAWISEWESLFHYIHLYTPHMANKHQELHAKLQEFEKFEERMRLVKRASRLYQYIFFERVLPVVDLEVILTRYQKLSCIRDIESRLGKISREVEAVARSMARRSKGTDEMMIQNVLVDGHNLAFRCLYAPGMSSLTDSQGRPTGIILGFLRSLGALKKRFPEAEFWIAWDGSSQRRKSKYPDYKANRKSGDQPVFDQIGFLKEILPLLGLRQVWNPEEEADDVIATLVREDLASQTNLIFSNDRDFMQLVTDSTKLLVPASGGRKEILFDIEGVRGVMGVPPDKVLQLRAFHGDTSDNLPGVARVPKKVTCTLIQSHGSVDRVYASGFVGVTKGQYERLRSAEPQVRINLDLMALVAVDVVRQNSDVDVKEAVARLSRLDIRSAPIVSSFFGEGAELSTGTL